MSFLLRPFLNSISALALAGCLLPAPGVFAQLTPTTPDSSALDGAGQHLQFSGDQDALLNHASQGYLGVGTRDIGTQEVAELKLKDARGAEIIEVDHDAPAGKAGLRIHDVILAVNGQTIPGEAQLRRILRGMAPGRTITLVISREGRQHTLKVKLADLSTLEAKAWSQHIPVPEPEDSDEYALPATGSGFGNGFISGGVANPLYTGLQLDEMGWQLARFFGVHSGHGLLVKRVDDDSPGAAAGLQAGDVIVRVNGRTITTTSQWEHALRSSEGKPMDLTVMRDHRMQTMKIVAGPLHTTSELDRPECESQWLLE
ncbi:MAG TPA: PDZ domain-containing protein [Acidobacteriaceae bacterium]|nr:PDZ domain-containing protein [Acidobacteriaceae bacterium]